MPVTIRNPEIIRALRLATDTDIALEIARLAEYGAVVIDRLAPNAPNAVANQAVVQLVGYIFNNQNLNDPERLLSHAVRNSGAAEVIGLYRGDGITPPLRGQRGEKGEPGAGGVLNVTSGRLPADPFPMQMAWSRPADPISIFTFLAVEGVTEGTTYETLSPPFPQAFRDEGLNSATLIWWVATDLQPASLPLDTGQVSDVRTPLQIGGVDGYYWVTVDPVSRFFQNIPFSILFPGVLIATQDWVTANFTAL